MKLIRRLLSIVHRPKRYWQIFLVITRTKPRRIMEIGIWTGDRAVKMIQLAKRYHRSADIEYYGFDLFGEMTPQRFAEEKSKWPSAQLDVDAKISATGAVVYLYQGDTAKTLPELASQLPRMDLIFIDGGHSLETIASDWLWASQLMHEKTVVIFDDYWLERLDAGCKLTVDAIDRSLYRVTLLPWIDSFKTTAFGPLRIKLAMVRRRTSH